MNGEKMVLSFTDRKDWRAWLDGNAHVATEAWIVIKKVHSTQPGLLLDDAVEEALCFGWIDSTLNTRDDESYLLRFSERKPESIWSMNNIRRVEALEKAGLMTESGLVKVRAAKASGEWRAAIERENTEIVPPDLEAALLQKKGAMAAYRNLPNSKKKQFLYWVQSAKREATKEKRIAEIVKRALADIGDKNPGN